MSRVVERSCFICGFRSDAPDHYAKPPATKYDFDVCLSCERANPGEDGAWAVGYGKHGSTEWLANENAALASEAANLRRRIRFLRNMMGRARDNLGVPQPGYAEPVAFAYHVLNNALVSDTGEEPSPDVYIPHGDDIAGWYAEPIRPMSIDQLKRTIDCIRDCAMEAEIGHELSGFRVSLLQRHGLIDGSDPAFGPVKYPDQQKPTGDPQPF